MTVGQKTMARLVGGHLVDLVLLEQVQVVHEVVQRAKVGAGHLPEDTAQLLLLVHQVVHWGGDRDGECQQRR